MSIRVCKVRYLEVVTDFRYDTSPRLTKVSYIRCKVSVLASITIELVCTTFHTTKLSVIVEAIHQRLMVMTHPDVTNTWARVERFLQSSLCLYLDGCN